MVSELAQEYVQGRIIKHVNKRPVWINATNSKWPYIIALRVLITFDAWTDEKATGGLLEVSLHPMPSPAPSATADSMYLTTT